MNLIWCQVYTFYCPPRKERCILLTEGTDVHIQQHIHQKYLNLCLSLHYYAKLLLLTWKKHKQEIQLCYDSYNQTK